jgi:UrcA family protein
MRHHLYAALAVAAFATASLPAFAQSVEELTVTGRMGPDGKPQSLSAAVSYADLDLRARADQAELRHRIAATAHDLCGKLGEPGPSRAALGRTCEDVAIRDAAPQVKLAIATAASRSALAYVAPEPAPVDIAPSVSAYSAPASATATYTMQTVTNGPVADTPENRARFGGPMSNAGKRTPARGN